MSNSTGARLGPAPVDGPFCRNCGARADVNYCPVCGQETRIELPTVGHFLAELAEQTLALQGQLWRTLIALMFKPGLLTVDYVAGRRQRYVRPLRLYLAVSIVFFAILGFNVSQNPDSFFISDEQEAAAKAVEPGTEASKDKSATGSTEPATPENTANPEPPKDKPASEIKTSKDGRTIKIDDKDKLTVNTGIPVLDARLKPRLDAMQALPQQEIAQRVFAAFINYAPVTIFFAMPFFALFLSIGYLWQRHNYAVHLLFAVNYHSFIFVVLMIEMLPGLSVFGGLLILAIPVYLVLALRRVYGGNGWFGISFFAFVISVAYLITLAVVMALGTLFSLAFL